MRGTTTAAPRQYLSTSHFLHPHQSLPERIIPPSPITRAASQRTPFLRGLATGLARPTNESRHVAVLYIFIYILIQDTLAACLLGPREDLRSTSRIRTSHEITRPSILNHLTTYIRFCIHVPAAHARNLQTQEKRGWERANTGMPSSPLTT